MVVRYPVWVREKIWYERVYRRRIPHTGTPCRTSPDCILLVYREKEESESKETSDNRFSENVSEDDFSPGEKNSASFCWKQCGNCSCGQWLFYSILRYVLKICCRTWKQQKELWYSFTFSGCFGYQCKENGKIAFRMGKCVFARDRSKCIDRSVYIPYSRTF